MTSKTEREHPIFPTLPIIFKLITELRITLKTYLEHRGVRLTSYGFSTNNIDELGLGETVRLCNFIEKVVNPSDGII